MHFCSPAVFYLKKALKLSDVYALHWWEMTVSTDLGANPESSSTQMDRWHLCKVSLKSTWLHMGAGVHFHGAHCRINTRIIHYSEFRLWQNPKHFVLWNSNSFLLLQNINSSRFNLGHTYSYIFLVNL